MHRDNLIRIVAVLAIVALWLGLSLAVHDPRILPSPISAATAARDMMTDGTLGSDVASSWLRVALGFMVGGALGVWFGIVTGRWPALDLTFGQLLSLLRPIPAIAIVPFVILWIGIGELGKMTIVAWAAMFPAWISTHLGIFRSDKRLEWVALSCGADTGQLIASVVLPGALPIIVAGLRTSLGAAFVSLYAAETAGASEGLGYLINESHLSFLTDRMVVGLVLLAASGALADLLFTKAVTRLAPWIFPITKR